MITQSLFKHEHEAIEDIEKKLDVGNLGFIINNLEFHDPQSNRYFETDIVVVCEFGIYVVELKHWSGFLEILPEKWIQNRSFFKLDPHRLNGFKAKLLRGIWERKFPSIAPPFFESVVVLTNPDATVVGAADPKTNNNNVTLHSVDNFVRYLRNQRKSKEKKLQRSQCEGFISFLREIHTVGPPKDFQFPGYEIVDVLYQYKDRAELVARRTDVRHHLLSRLRLFYPPNDVTEIPQFRERATATLNAVSKVGDHPNLLKVWLVPNENDFIVEGSDWSETGTLRELMNSHGKFSVDRAIQVVGGILRGLEVIHQEYVIHRSLSPENVLMFNDLPKLMNFDLSFQLEDNRVTVIPDVSELQRNAYIAPEIYRGDSVEVSADLFSVGVILYELLVGEKPFGYSIDLDRWGGELEPAKNEKMVNEQVPAYVIDIINQLVSSKPETRLQSASSVLELLEGSSVESPIDGEVNPILESGAQCGIYQIEDFFRHGAESQIYIGRGALSDKVAIKLFNHGVALKRITNEQKSAADVVHPSIVRVESCNQWNDGRFYIPFKWVSDRNLQDEIETGIKPDFGRFKKIAHQLLDAVKCLHRNTEDDVPVTILHNDIKPENILITSTDRPVLIDFGVSSPPGIRIYEGTVGYVAPDHCLGQDRYYCESGDLYALGVTLREWYLSSDEDNYQLGLLKDWFDRATAKESDSRFSSIEEMNDALEVITEENYLQILEPLPELNVLPATETGIEPLQRERPDSDIPILDTSNNTESLGLQDPNPFVAYLNSLHSRSAGNENALAESQALNPFFNFLHVLHPVTDSIEKHLTSKEKRHVVLTGHAGDGKSTIAIDIFKRLARLPKDLPLNEGLPERAEVLFNDLSIVIIKDFSEWSDEDRIEIIKEMISESDIRYLLISNTGTLLDSFTRYEEVVLGNQDWVHTESKLLGALDNVAPQEVTFYETNLWIINLSMMDNIDIAQEIFKKMIASARWEICLSQECQHHCPIFQNVKLIKANEQLVSDRLFLIYRRLAEYGTRFTLRQLSAHLAYSITSGLTYDDILKLEGENNPLSFLRYLFFNRFFGDNGLVTDGPSLQLKTISVIREQGFGELPCQSIERKLWHQGRDRFSGLIANGDIGIFDQLRLYGAKMRFDEKVMDSAQARKQVRRMLYFLHNFEGNSGDDFIKRFLKSKMIIEYGEWQKRANDTLQLHEARDLRGCILHVLQEYMTGVRLPKGRTSDSDIFITLGRKSQEIRQSAQVVLANFPLNDFEVSLNTVSDGISGKKRELLLTCNTGQSMATLRLDLPFLDYVIMRDAGEIGAGLQASYLDRLEKFKSELLIFGKKHKADNVMLVRLLTSHNFKKQIFAVHDSKLEVASD